MTREQQARLLIAKGYSCEQAIFGAFADLLGCSTVGAALLAPSRKERGQVCGAYRAALTLISFLSTPKPHGKKRSKKRAERAGEKEKQKAAEAEGKFRKLFLGEFGTLDCAEIKRVRETGWGGMDNVVGITVQLLERVLTKE